MRRHSLPCLLALGLAGCAGYQLGPTGGQVAGAKSVQVVAFANQTMEPRVTDAVLSALRKTLQRDGTYHLATREDGDIVVSGTITRYHRNELSYQPSDVLTVKDYRVALTAQVMARERGTGRILFDQPVTGYTLVRVGSDLSSSERQAMPLLAEDLAKRVTTLLVNGSW